MAMSSNEKLSLQSRDGELVYTSNDKSNNTNELRKLVHHLSPLFGEAWHRHNLVSLRVDSVARVLYYAELYKKIVDVPGVICEFGVHWGAGMSLLINMRSILEPFNQSRVIHGFDTFDGFPSVDVKDGVYANAGDYKSTNDYEVMLAELLKLHESFAPMNDLVKHRLIKGDASVTIDEWLDDNPHAIISMAIFDMDLYKPTKDVLEKIVPRLTRGSLLVFDELNCEFFPGETRALDEVLGLNNLRLHRTPLQSHCAWAVYGE
jgi:hypothetical protein